MENSFAMLLTPIEKSSFEASLDKFSKKKGTECKIYQYLKKFDLR